jgi:hypothetical protein
MKNSVFRYCVCSPFFLWCFLQIWGVLPDFVSGVGLHRRPDLFARAPVPISSSRFVSISCTGFVGRDWISRFRFRSAPVKKSFFFIVTFVNCTGLVARSPVPARESFFLLTDFGLVCCSSAPSEIVCAAD